MSRKNNISFNKPPEPEFIRRMKERVGWKEGPTVDTKRETSSSANDDDPEGQHVEPDDEKPTVVILKDGDLTAEEAEQIQKDLDLDDKTPGKIKFRKPTTTNSKRSSSDTGLNASTKKVKTTADSEAISRRSQDSKDRNEKEESRNTPKTKPPIVNSLLSFGGDDEEEDDG